MIYYFLIYIFIFLGGFHYKFQYYPKNAWFLFIITIWLIFTAAFRAEGVDNDMRTYILNAKEGWGIAEPSFFLISNFSQKVLHSIRFIFIIYAGLSIIVKIYALKKLSPLLYLTLAFYYCLNFGVHEMNQIRLGVGAGFFLLLVYCKINKQPIIKGLTCGIIAVFFHFSLIIPCIIIIFLSNSERYIKTLIYLIPCSYLFYLMGLSVIDSLALLDGGYISDKIRFYKNFNMDIFCILYKSYATDE